MMRSLTVILSILLMLLLGACGGGETAVMGPAEVMDAYTEAINNHDVEAALALVADDAVYERPAGSFNGKEEIRGFIEDLIARDVQVELVGERTVDGERVTWQSHVRIKDPANPDGPLLELMNNSESTVRDGQIVHHRAEPASQ
jgi:hypothetical protein